jgi:SAM-dependent methyltransferase
MRTGRLVTNPQMMNNAVVRLQADGTIYFDSPDAPGAGIFYVDMDRFPIELPVFLRIDYRLATGKLYATLITGDWQVISPSPQSEGSEGSVYLYIDTLAPGMRFMVGLQSPGAKGQIGAISTVPCSSLSAADFKRLRAAEFPFWYAEADLGDSVYIPASIPPEAMAGTRRSHAIMKMMLEETVGPLDGKSGIDVGCSSGYHTIQLARHGAVMTGLDPFDQGIRQAKLVAECNRDVLSSAPRFVCQSVYEYKPEKPVDFVYCVGVLYHLSDPIGALRRLYDFCARGAVIGCCVSPTAGEFFELSNSVKYGFCQPTECTLVPTASALRRACEHVGFRVTKMADWSEFEGEPSPAPRHPRAGWARAATELEGDQIPVLRHIPKEIDIPIGPVYYSLKK